MAQCGVADNYKFLLPPCPPDKLSALIWATVCPLHIFASEIPAQLLPLLGLPGPLRLPGHLQALTLSLSLSLLWVPVSSTTLDFQLLEVRNHVLYSFASLKHCSHPWYSTDYILRLVNVFT